MAANYSQRVLQRQFNQLIASNGCVELVAAATVDGHLVAQAARSGRDCKRLAAMASSLVALGDTLADEQAMGSCRNLIVENEGGIVVFMHITKSLLLIARTDNRSSLSALLAAARGCVSDVIAELKAAILPQ